MNDTDFENLLAIGDVIADVLKGELAKRDKRIADLEERDREKTAEMNRLKQQMSAVQKHTQNLERKYGNITHGSLP